MSCGSVKPAHWTTDQSDCGNECFHLSRQSSWVNDFGWMISLITCLSFALHLILFFFSPVRFILLHGQTYFLCVSQFSVRVSITFSNLDYSTCQLTSRFLPWQVPCKLIFLFTGYYKLDTVHSFWRSIFDAQISWAECTPFFRWLLIRC